MRSGRVFIDENPAEFPILDAGPALTFSYNPKTSNLCVGVGAGGNSSRECGVPLLCHPVKLTRGSCMKQNLYWLVLGGLAFWMPFVLLSATHKWTENTLALNLASVAVLALVSLISWVVRKKIPKWGWALAGVYILGPTATFAAWALSPFSSSASLPADWIWRIAFCLLPPMTLWLALLSGMIFSVLFATLALPLLLLLPRRDQVSSHEKADQHPLRTG